MASIFGGRLCRRRSPTLAGDWAVSGFGLAVAGFPHYFGGIVDVGGLHLLGEAWASVTTLGGLAVWGSPHSLREALAPAAFLLREAWLSSGSIMFCIGRAVAGLTLCGRP